MYSPEKIGNSVTYAPITANVAIINMAVKRGSLRIVVVPMIRYMGAHRPKTNGLRYIFIFLWSYFKMLARVQGFEPQFSESESDVLPLDDTRIISILIVLCYFCAVKVSRKIEEMFIVNCLDETN